MRRFALVVCGLIFVFAATRPPAVRADLQTTYARVRPGVVYIICAVPDGAVSGSGFILESDNSKSEIVTANHVVEGASAIDVIVGNDPHRRYHANVLQSDHVGDVAILEIPVGHLHALQFASSASIKEGMTVAAIGYPRAASVFERVDGDSLRPSIHAGILSAIRLSGVLYQFDAAVDHGDSGGPVIEASSGKVIGIVRGALLDPSFLARGLEQPLPGSAIAMSGITIEKVVRGEAIASTAPTSSDASASKPATNPVGSSIASAFRLGFVTPSMQATDQQQVVNTLSSRIVGDMGKDNSLYLIPTADVKGDSTKIFGACQDSRLNGFMVPGFAWNWKNYLQWYPFVGNQWERDVNSAVSLSVFDCSGGKVFSDVKSKSETKSPMARTWDTEVVSMDDDLVDQIEKDFATFRETNSAAWANFLKTGLFIDPNDQAPHALFTVSLEKGVCRVVSVFPGGPAASAGLRVGDIITTVNGQDTSTMALTQVQGLITSTNIILAVKRPEGTVNIDVVGRPYNALVRMLSTQQQ